MKEITNLCLKTVLNLAFAIAVLINTEEWGAVEKMVSIFLVVVNIPLIFYIYVKRGEYKRRFARKRFKSPSSSSLLTFLAELIALSSLYCITKKYLLGLAHAILSIILDVTVWCTFKRKKEVVKRQSKNIFEVVYMRVPYVVNNRVVLNREEAVQVLDRVSGNVLVRKHNGEEYTLQDSFLYRDGPEI
jgi:hypothetical protein